MISCFNCPITDRSSWLDGAHPSVEDDEVLRKVCFSNRPTGCKYPTEISVGYSQRNRSGIYIDAMVHFFSEILHSPLFVIILGFTHVTFSLTTVVNRHCRAPRNVNRDT